jgi:hypothetical protein
MSRRNKKRRHKPVPQTTIITEETPEARESGPSAFVAPQESALVIREPQDRDDLVALHMLMLVQGQEMAQATVNSDKVMAKIVAAARDPQHHSMLMAIKDGRLAGFLCLEQVPFWYSDQFLLMDWGFYVLPKYRNGDVGRELLASARVIAEAVQQPLYVAINNPSRRRGTEKAATIAGFVPQGFVLRVNAGFPPPRTN